RAAGHEVRHVVVAGDSVAASSTASGDARVLAFDELRASTAPRSEPAPTRRDDFAFWLYSSGSTGRPKAGVPTHANPDWTAELYGRAVLGIDARDVVFSAAKLFFAYGLGNALSFPLSIGARVVLMADRPTPDAIARRLVREHVTLFCGAPTAYAALLAS